MVLHWLCPILDNGVSIVHGLFISSYSRLDNVPQKRTFGNNWSMFCKSVFLRIAQLHTHTRNRFMALWILSGKTWVSWYQKKYSPASSVKILKSVYICLDIILVY